MKKRYVILPLFFIFLIIANANAETNAYEVYWDTGTTIEISATISSTSLDTGYHTISITVSLEALNYEAVDIHDIQVEIRIPGYFSTYVTFNTISSIGGYDTSSTSFQYSTSWGTNYLQLKLTCRENIPLAIDPELYTDWINYFTIEPYEAPTTPTDTTPSGTGTDDLKLLPIILGSIGGAVVLGAMITTIVILTRKQRMVASPIQHQQYSEIVSTKALFCTNCGSEIEIKDQFCSNCGARKSA